ncbi:hypothetical protein FI667_g16124, partial [Globisporangium splendens]
MITTSALDPKDFQATTDIDLIMDDDDPTDAADLWQDTAATLLFADVSEEVGMKQQFFELDLSGSTCSKQSLAPSARNQWCVQNERRGSEADRAFFGGIERCASAPLPSTVKFEPSHEPCTDDIPWTDLVFWLGDAATGEVQCSCTKCVYERTRRGHRRFSPYGRISSKIPVINLPRIEGVN